MGDEQMFTQVELGNEAKKYVAWVPSKFGKAGKRLTIEGQPGTWTVLQSYATKTRQFIDDARMARMVFDSCLENA